MKAREEKQGNMMKRHEKEAKLAEDRVRKIEAKQKKEKKEKRKKGTDDSKYVS